VNISNFASPTLLGSYDTPGLAYGVFVQDSTVFIADWGVGMQIVNISNLVSPSLLSTCYRTLSQARDIVVQNNIAFVAAGNGGLQIVNVSNLSNPVLLSGYAMPDIAFAVFVQDDVAFVASGAAGLQMVNIANPAAPFLLGSYNTPGYAQGVFAQGKTVYVADKTSGLQILTLSNWALTISPNTSHVGNHQVRVTVTDPLGASGSDTFLLRVEGPPQFVNATPPQYAKVGQTFNYFVPQKTVFDPNFDTPAFTATVKGQNTLFPWLSFNGISAAFAGTPQPQDVGNFTITLSVTDNVPGTAIVTQDFILYVDRAPVLKQNIPAQLASFGKLFNFSVPSGAFADPDGDTLTYEASGRNQAPLPTWLRFNNQTQTFTGSPNASDAGTVDLVVSATDPYGGRVEGSFSVRVAANSPPQLNNPIFSQVASVGNPFSVVIDPATFSDPDGNALTYSATQVGGAPLPGWLKFDAQRVSFSGTPGRGDTNHFTDRVLQIDLSASDGAAQPAHAVFNVNVQGTSWAELALQIGAPLVSALGTGLAVYKQRALLLNRCNKKKYQRVPNHLEPGEYFEQVLQAPLADIRQFAIQIPRSVPSCCRFFAPPYRPMPGVAGLPNWLEHDRKSNSLRSIQPIPANLAGETLIIQVTGDGNVILEEFKLSIAQPNLKDRVPSASQEAAEADDVEMAELRRVSRS
jgi:hypothetical protein